MGGALAVFLEELERQFGPELPSLLLSLIACSAYGIEPDRLLRLATTGYSDREVGTLRGTIASFLVDKMGALSFYDRPFPASSCRPLPGRA